MSNSSGSTAQSAEQKYLDTKEAAAIVRHKPAHTRTAASDWARAALPQARQGVALEGALPSRGSRSLGGGRGVRFDVGVRPMTRSSHFMKRWFEQPTLRDWQAPLPKRPVTMAGEPQSLPAACVSVAGRHGRPFEGASHRRGGARFPCRHLDARRSGRAPGGCRRARRSNIAGASRRGGRERLVHRLSQQQRMPPNIKSSTKEVHMTTTSKPKNLPDFIAYAVTPESDRWRQAFLE